VVWPVSGSNHADTISIKKYVDIVPCMCHFCSYVELMKETSTCPVPSKPLRAPLSIDARRLRIAKRADRTVDLLEHGASFAGIMARGKAESPGNGAAKA
jgi:hypothetical protein